MSAPDLVRWHWEKAGTIEHVHWSMKDELGAGVLPSQRFGANAAWFRINAITYNLLTLLKRRALPERFRLARPKGVMSTRRVDNDSERVVAFAQPVQLFHPVPREELSR